MAVRPGQQIAIPIAIVATMTMLVGCSFDRDYEGSELMCATGNRCPDGFRCDTMTNRCVTETTPDGAIDVPDATPPPDATPLTVCERAAAAQDNDLCADAIDITVDVASEGGGIFFGDTTGYANHINPAIIVDCTGSPEPGNDAIYRFDANAGDSLVVSLHTDEGWDGAIYLLDACSSSATCLGGDDQIGKGVIDEATIPIAANGTYYLIVDASTVGAFGCYTLTAELL